MNGDLRRIGSRQGPAKSDYTAKLVNLVEEKWSGEVKLDGSGILVVFTDILQQISSRSGPRNF
eukprot:scaffold56177_cov24-Phaeocystis_antarctica.AAC.1